jgi:hypothetical protein
MQHAHFETEKLNTHIFTYMINYYDYLKLLNHGLPIIEEPLKRALKSGRKYVKRDYQL